MRSQHLLAAAGDGMSCVDSSVENLVRVGWVLCCSLGAASKQEEHWLVMLGVTMAPLCNYLPTHHVWQRKGARECIRARCDSVLLLVWREQQSAQQVPSA